MKRCEIKAEFIRHRCYLTKGMAEIYAFRAIIMFVTASGVFIKYLIKIDLPLWIYVTAGLLLSIGCWLIGYYWDKMHLYDTEMDFNNKRNPAMRKLLRKK